MPIDKIKGLPDIEEIESQVEAEIFEKAKPKRLWGKYVLVGLVIVVIILAGINLTKTQVFTSVAGLGSVSGVTVNSLQTPVPAEIFVLKTNYSTIANATGNFLLEGIPAGDVHIIVAFEGIGKEIPLVITAGQNFSLGQIEVEETALPPAE